MAFAIGRVTVEVLSEQSTMTAVPPSEWRGDRVERVGTATIANLSAADGLRAQVSLVRWPNGEEFSLGHAEIFSGPADYGRLADAGLISPKCFGDHLVARIRALKYGDDGRARGSATDWPQIDEWAGEDAQAALRSLGATGTGLYGELLPSATRFRMEPAVEVRIDDPRALFAVYALTRVVPIMTGYGRSIVEGPYA